MKNEKNKTEDQICRFCENSDSILTKENCCTGCSKLEDFKKKLQDLKNSKEYKEANEITQAEFKLALHLRQQLIK